jgi:hypothetical protein
VHRKDLSVAIRRRRAAPVSNFEAIFRFRPYILANLRPSPELAMFTGRFP